MISPKAECFRNYEYVEQSIHRPMMEIVSWFHLLRITGCHLRITQRGATRTEFNQNFPAKNLHEPSPYLGSARAEFGTVLAAGCKWRICMSFPLGS